MIWSRTLISEPGGEISCPECGLNSEIISDRLYHPSYLSLFRLSFLLSSFRASECAWRFWLAAFCLSPVESRTMCRLPENCRNNIPPSFNSLVLESAASSACGPSCQLQRISPNWRNHGHLVRPRTRCPWAGATRIQLGFLSSLGDTIDKINSSSMMIKLHLDIACVVASYIIDAVEPRVTRANGQH